MWVQPRIDADVRDAAEDRDPDQLVNLTYCRAIRVRGVREPEGDPAAQAAAREPIDDASHAVDPEAPPPETPHYRRWEVMAVLGGERGPGQRATETLASVASEAVARRLFRQIKRGLLGGALGIDLSATSATGSLSRSKRAGPDADAAGGA